MAVESMTMTEVETQQVSPAPSDVIVVEDLWRTYDMGSEQQVQALRGVISASSTMSMSRSWAHRAQASQR